MNTPPVLCLSRSIVHLNSLMTTVYNGNSIQACPNCLAEIDAANRDYITAMNDYDDLRTELEELMDEYDDCRRSLRTTATSALQERLGNVHEMLASAQIKLQEARLRNDVAGTSQNMCRQRCKDFIINGYEETAVFRS